MADKHADKRAVALAAARRRAAAKGWETRRANAAAKQAAAFARSAAAKRGWITRKARSAETPKGALKQFADQHAKPDGHNVVRYNGKWRTSSRFRTGKHINRLVRQTLSPFSSTVIQHNIMVAARAAYQPGDYLRILINVYFYGNNGGGKSAKDVKITRDGVIGYLPVGTGQSSHSLHEFEAQVQRQLAQLEKQTRNVYYANDFTVKSYRDRTIASAIAQDSDEVKLLRW